MRNDEWDDNKKWTERRREKLEDLDQEIIYETRRNNSYNKGTCGRSVRVIEPIQKAKKMY